MAKQQISRLKETAFSHYNLRDAYIQDIPEYYSSLRDEVIFSNYGVKVLVKIPIDPDGKLNENNVSEYSDFVDIQWRETTETIVPLFKEYRQNLSEEGMTADGTDGLYALECILPSKLHIPRNSRIIFSEYNSREEKIAREWTVLGTVSKQLSNSKTYTRIANCVPSRQAIFTTSELAMGTFWFDYIAEKLNNYNDLRAHGTFWFLRIGVAKGCLGKLLPGDEYIREQIEEPEYPTYREKLKEIFYYDSREQHILNAGSGFIVGQLYTVTNGTDPIQIETEEETYTDLQIIPYEVGSNGELISFRYVPETGLTELSQRGTINNASINVLTTANIPSTIKETIDFSKLDGAKLLRPYEAEACFYGKDIMVSVLN